MKFKSVKNAISWSAVAGFITYLTAFTFAGTILCTSLVGWGIAAVVFAVLIEGTVYAKNIFEAAKNSDYENAIELTLAEDDLRQLKGNKDNAFIEDYFILKEHLHELSENLANYEGSDKVIAEKRIARIKKHLAEMVALNRDYIKGMAWDNDTNTYKNSLIRSLKTLHHITLPTLRIKLENRAKWMKRSIAGSIGSGIFSGISAYCLILFKFAASPLIIKYLTTLGITLAFTSPIGVPLLLAGLAALGSMLMMYGAASKVIKRGKLDKWLERMHVLIKPNTHESTALQYLKKFLMYAAFPVLILLATASAAWSFCSPIINFSTNILLRVVTLIVWPCMITLTLLFNTDNALESLQKVAHDAAQTWENIKKAWNEETFFQFINPFRHARRLIMLCHGYSIGISTDNLPFIHPLITAIFGAIVELLTDWHYGAESGSNASHKELALEQDKNHKPDSCHHDGHDHKHNKESFSQSKMNGSNPDSSRSHSHDDDDEENDHDHGSFLDVPVRFFNKAAVRWDYYTGKRNYSWQEARNKFIPSPKLPELPRVSETLRMYLIDSELAAMEQEYGDKGITTNDKDIAQSKKDAFSKLRNSLYTMTLTPSAEKKGEKTERASAILSSAFDNYPILSKNRYSYFNSPPDSKNAIQDILNDEILRARPIQV